MSGGQEKNFSTLGPKLRGNKAQQDNGDKQRQICIEVINYWGLFMAKKLIKYCGIYYLNSLYKCVLFQIHKIFEMKSSDQYRKRSKVCQMMYLLWVFIFISIGYNMIVKQVFSTSRLQSHKFILANIEQTVKM